MRFSLGPLLGAVTLSAIPIAHGLAPGDIPSDTPVSQLLSSASANLAQGNAGDALVYFDVAITRDPSNYLSIFKRGAAYLSLGKTTQANQDFDRVLAIKPGFEGALIQRAKIRSRRADWAGAKDDYSKINKSEESSELEQAEVAAQHAREAESKEEWDECIAQAQTAILVASQSAALRKTRAHCRFERGDTAEGIADLQHLLQLAPEDTLPHLQISGMRFYSLGDTEKGLEQIRRCLQSDPDNKACSKLYRQEKGTDRGVTKVRDLMQKKQYNSAVKMLVKQNDEEEGLIEEVKAESTALREQGVIHPKSNEGLYHDLMEMACEAYYEMGKKDKALSYCTFVLEVNPQSLVALLFKAQSQIDKDEFESAINILNEAKDSHPGDSSRINPLLQNAQTLLKRSKTKDYYKVLGLDRDADERQIKAAYRKLTREWHPDKAAKNGMTKEEAEKKMASINEAYEVLKDPELKQRFDRGDDPNDQTQGQPFQGSPFGGGQQFVFRQGGGPNIKFGGGTFNFPGGNPFGGGGGFPFG